MARWWGKVHNRDNCAGFAVHSEEKGFRGTGDVWLILTDINLRTIPQDALCQVTFTSKIHLQDLQFQLHFFSSTLLCTHSHMCLLAHRPMDSHTLVWAARCVLHAAKSATRPQIREQGCDLKVENTVINVYFCCHECGTSS